MTTVEELERFHLLPHLVDLLACGFNRSARQDEEEFLTADTAHHVARPNALDKDRGRLAKSRIARVVTELIVESLEVVEIEHDHTQGRRFAFRAADLAQKGLLRVAPVVQPSERVAQ